jgi:phosphoribosylformylglycinamidine (FGAM) synthase-like enzyme
VEASTPLRPDHYLFSESPSRVVVSVRREKEEEFLNKVADLDVNRLGEVTEETFQIGINEQPLISIPIKSIFQVWNGFLDGVFEH